MSETGKQTGKRRPWARKSITIFSVIAGLYLLTGFLFLPLGIKLLAPGIAARYLEGEVSPGWIYVNPLTFEFSAKNVSWSHQSGEEMAGFDSLLINANPIGSLLEMEWRIETIRLGGARANLRVNKDGSVNILGSIRERPESGDSVEEPVRFSLPGLWIGSLELWNATLSVTDLRRDQPFRKVLNPINFRMENLHTGPEVENKYQFSAATQDEERIKLSGIFLFNPFSLHGSLSGKEFRISDYTLLVTEDEDLRIHSGILDFSLEFKVGLLEKPLTASVMDARINVRDLDLQLTGDLDAKVQLVNSSLKDINIEVSLGGQEGLQLEAEAGLQMEGLRAVMAGKSKPFASFESFRLEDARFNLNPLSIETGDIVLTKPQVLVERNEEGKFILLAGRSTVEDTTVDEGMLSNEEERKEFPSVMISRFVLEGGEFEFRDASLAPVAYVNVTPVNLTMEALTLPSSQPTKSTLSATIQETGSLLLEGEFLAGDPLEKSSVTLTLESIPLADFTPYSTAFTGRPIENGTFSGNFILGLDGQKLNTDNKLNIQSIRFGDLISGYEGKTYPVGTIVALMENNKGLIEIALPISGSLDDPNFHPFQAFTGLLRKLVLKAATAPFNLVANMTGGVISGIAAAATGTEEEAPDYSRLKFPPGKSIFSEEASEIIKVIGDMMDSRPRILLGVQGSVDPVADLETLKMNRFAEKLESFTGEGYDERIRNAYRTEILEDASPPTNQPGEAERTDSDEEETVTAGMDAEPDLYPDKDRPQQETERFYLRRGPRRPTILRQVVGIEEAPHSTAKQDKAESVVALDPETESITKVPGADSGETKVADKKPSPDEEKPIQEQQLPSVSEMNDLLEEFWFDKPPSVDGLARERVQVVIERLSDNYGIHPERLKPIQQTLEEGPQVIFRIKTRLSDSDE